MKLRIACFVIWNSLIVIAVVLLMRSCFAPEPVVIEKEKIQYNTILRDITGMTDAEKQCYYTGIPYLDIEYKKDFDYILKAGLCDREWSRPVSIRPRDSPRNMFIAGPVLSIRGAGVFGQYYRMWGNFGFGGGAAYSRDGPLIQAGVVYMR